MICQICLEKQANYHFTKIINGNKTEYHLCDGCARENGDIIQGPGNSFSIHNLLSGIVNIEFGPTVSTPPAKVAEPRCQTCGMTFRQFSQKGRFGCSQCYTAFADKLDPLIRRVQSQNTMHTGKVPRRAHQLTDEQRDFEQLIEKLEQDLLAEIKNEHYERAAVLRDRIHDIRKNWLSRTAPNEARASEKKEEG
jgi:protein arginine kinase activator